MLLASRLTMGTSLLIQLVNSRLTLGLVVLLPSDVGGSG